MDQKGKALARNDAQWESLKDDIFRVYIAEDHTLAITMTIFEQMYQFKRSPRKWKDKLKQWNFDKNLSEKDAKILVAKAEKRAREEGKETEFLHYGLVMSTAKINNAKRRRTMDESVAMSPSAATPPAITYRTPRPDPDDDDATEAEDHMEHIAPSSQEVEIVSLDSDSGEGLYSFRSQEAELGTAYPAIRTYGFAVPSSEAAQHTPSNDYSIQPQPLSRIGMDHSWEDTMPYLGPSSVISGRGDNDTLDIPLSMQMPPPPRPSIGVLPTVQYNLPTNDVIYSGEKHTPFVQSAFYPHGWTKSDGALIERLCSLQDIILGAIYRLDFTFINRLVSSPSALEWYLAGPFLSKNFLEFISMLSLTLRISEVFREEEYFERADFFTEKAMSGYLALHHRFQQRPPLSTGEQPGGTRQTSPDSLRRLLFSFLCLYSAGHINFSHFSDCFEAVSKKITKSHGASNWGPRHEEQGKALAKILLRYTDFEWLQLVAQESTIAAEFNKLPKKRGAKQLFAVISGQLSQTLDSDASYARKILGIMMIFYHAVHYKLSYVLRHCLGYLNSAHRIISIHDSRIDFERWPENGGQWSTSKIFRVSRPAINAEFMQQTTSFILQFTMPPSSQIELRQQMRSLADQRHEIDSLLQEDNNEHDAMNKKEILKLDVEILQLLIDDLPNLGKELKCMIGDDSSSELKDDML
ncbi:uncharacterized protein PAC_10667 [Phialocephala subalpina]|uniref:Clr5 domain-containing protein n=1 Tax=Phialocephala subalpina TaxID=576137 RepID=A0A1L7X6X6_9HELO|nr:uncharacterized protein PAC_10667 [Phialocephala subalpina]